MAASSMVGPLIVASTAGAGPAALRTIAPMRAAILREHGGVPEIADHPDPTGPDVVEVVAAAMNPVDVRIATGAFPMERYEPPYVAGKEGIGRRPDGSLVYFEYSAAGYGAFAEKTALAPDD